MACGEPPAPGSLLSTCREPDSPHLRTPLDTLGVNEEYAQTVVAMTKNEVGAVSEEAASRFLHRNLHLATQGDHAVNARGIDLITVSRSSTVAMIEVKGTAGLALGAQAANAAGRAENFSSLTGRNQGSDAWLNTDPSLKESGVDAAISSGMIGARVNLLSQSIDLYERNDHGGWDHVGGPYHCPADDLVAEA
jgi:hypothetical protein